MSPTAETTDELRRAHAEHSADLSALRELLRMRGPTGCNRLDAALAERMREDAMEIMHLQRNFPQFAQ